MALRLQACTAAPLLHRRPCPRAPTDHQPMLPSAALNCAQAAQHVQLITAAIAQRHHKDSDACIFLRAHNKAETTVRGGSCGKMLALLSLGEAAQCLGLAGWLAWSGSMVASVVGSAAARLPVAISGVSWAGQPGASLERAAGSLLSPTIGPCAAGHAKHAD